jgi:rubrerythrin
MPVQNGMTADFLRSAYGGESMAHMRYIAWGHQAEKEGFPNIGKLFKAISYAEQVHATNHFKELAAAAGDKTVTAGAVFGMGSLVDNLQGAINGELHEVGQMYPVYLQTAQFQSEKGAERSFHFALEAEKLHAELFKKAQNSAKQGKDLELKSVNICPICGHTIVDGIPDNCPVCGAKKEMYVTF